MIDGCKPITTLKKMTFPHRMLFFDTESFIHSESETLEKHTLKLGVCIFIITDDNQEIIHKEIYRFRTIEEFWDYVGTKTKKDNVLYIYAHNAKYDTLNVNVTTELVNRGYDVPFPTIDNAFIISAKRNRHKLKIIDSFNYIRLPIKTIGEKLGLEKLDINFENASDEELFIYCERDVEITMRFIVQFFQLLKKEKLGEPKYTTASTALNIYRHRFITEPIYYHKNDNLLLLERNGYRGGIVECFKINRLKKQKYYLLDINSMYVSVMSNCKLPTYPILFNENGNIEDLINSVKSYYVIADVVIRVKTNKGKYGIKHDNKLIFPIGTFRVTLHNPELLEAIKNNSIIKVFSYAVYNAEYCLKDYALYFSELKKNSTSKVDYELAKLLGNGLYGKFGMRKYEQIELDFSAIFSDQLELSNKTKEKLNTAKPLYIPSNKGIFYLWGDKYYRTDKNDLIHVPRTNVALAGAVTAYSRILLSKYLEICGDKNAYYSDTDSIMVNEKGYKNLLPYIDDKELGKLKVEFVFNGGVINAPKNYTFTNKRILKYKGISNKHFIQCVNIKHRSIIIKKRVRNKGIPTNSINENGTFYFWRFTTFKDYFRSDGELKGRVLRNRKNSLDYTKGNKSNDGFTKPFVMEYINDENKIR